ncbi:hypothetical protein [Methanotorris formicicus]|uniref:Uncharacterized protein n=1 Tax=Methanotorris formicicus Mc-S-70 TaxID=647171 RepID=H1L0T1_9EURY|nr:hypothetical protein [Methanotorris formicicus]EHP84481.1 hypothetical protein MetfoDRAFT_1655 [Methanotorris formicicus Mc-S-70]
MEDFIGSLIILTVLWYLIPLNVKIEIDDKIYHFQKNSGDLGFKLKTKKIED